MPFFNGTPYACAMSTLRSKRPTSTFTTLKCWRIRGAEAPSLNAMSSTRQSGHQLAPKTTRTGTLARFASARPAWICAFASAASSYAGEAANADVAASAKPRTRARSLLMVLDRRGTSAAGRRCHKTTGQVACASMRGAGCRTGGAGGVAAELERLHLAMGAVVGRAERQHAHPPGALDADLVRMGNDASALHGVLGAGGEPGEHAAYEQRDRRLVTVTCARAIRSE